MGVAIGTIMAECNCSLCSSSERSDETAADAIRSKAIRSINNGSLPAMTCDIASAGPIGWRRLYRSTYRNSSMLRCADRSRLHAGWGRQRDQAPIGKLADG